VLLNRTIIALDPGLVLVLAAHIVGQVVRLRDHAQRLLRLGRHLEILHLQALGGLLFRLWLLQGHIHSCATRGSHIKRAIVFAHFCRLRTLLGRLVHFK